MSACEYTVAEHHSDDLIEVFTGRITPVLLCGFHERYFKQEALAHGYTVTRAAVDLMVGGTTTPVDNRRNVLILRATKGTPDYAYALRVILARRRTWLQWHTDRQSAARREPRTQASAERYYRLDLQMGGTPEYITKRAQEFLAHHEKKVRCI